MEGEVKVSLVLQFARVPANDNTHTTYNLASKNTALGKYR